jgi:hypothetical protein
MLLPWHEVSGMVRISLPEAGVHVTERGHRHRPRWPARADAPPWQARQVLQLAAHCRRPDRTRPFNDLDALAGHCRTLLVAPACRNAALALAIPAASLAYRQLVLPAAAEPVQRLSQVRRDGGHGLDAAAYEPDYQVLGPQPGSAGDGRSWPWPPPTLAIEDRLALAEVLHMRLAGLPPEDLCLRDFLRQDRPARTDAVLRLDAAAAG